MGELHRCVIVDADLDKPLQCINTGTLLATLDKNANRFGARVMRGGVPVDLTGCAVQGFFIRRDFDMVLIDGAVDEAEGAVYVDLPAACYAQEGGFTLTVKIMRDYQTLTVCTFDGYIKMTQTGAYVDDGEVVTSIDYVLSKIDEMEAVAEDAKSTVARTAPAIVGTASGTTVTITDAAARPALSVVSEIRTLQSNASTAAPDNVRPIVRQEVKLYHAAAYDAAAEPVLTADLPDIAYGGTLDWATGKLTVTHYQYVPTGADITNYGTASTGVPYVQFVLPERYAGSGVSCSNYPVTTGTPTNHAVRLVAPLGCYIYDPRFTDQATAAALIDAEKPQIVFALQTPLTLQVDPVTLTLLEGSNALWSGLGDTSVEYIVDTKTYIDAQIAAAVASAIAAANEEIDG